MNVKIKDKFLEIGLTLEEAYILGRVQYFEDEGLPYYESNEAIAKLLHKSRSYIKKCINELVENGYLNKTVSSRRRLLSINHTEKEVTEKPLIEGTRKPLIEVTEKPLIEGTRKPLIEGTRKPLIEVTEKPHIKGKHSSINNLSKEEQLKKIQEALDRMPKANEEDYY